MNERARPKAFAAAKRPAQVENAPAAAKIAVLLINLGTPDDTSYWPMRRYLKEFLSDRRVIETNRALWWLILNGVVLVKRPFASGAKYRSIWNEELDESPLRTITRRQAEKVAASLASWQGIVVDWAMRYGSPSIASRIEALAAQGCDRLLAFPLYPQYAAATTATANDKTFEALKTLRAQPALRTVPAYPTDPVYIEALAQRDQDASRRSRFRARGDPRLVPRPAAVLRRPGRSLSGAMCRHHRGAACGARPTRAEAQANLPVALRRCRVDQALH